MCLKNVSLIMPLLINALQGLSILFRVRTELLALADTVPGDLAPQSLPELTSCCSLPCSLCSSHAGFALLFNECQSCSCFQTFALVIPSVRRAFSRHPLAHSLTCHNLCSDAAFSLRLFLSAHTNICLWPAFLS